MKRIYYLAIALFSVLPSFAQKNLRLWYNKPAAVWEETLPLGNGRLGMMPDGGIDKEKIVLNDITLWSGAPQDANNYNAYKQLPKIKQLLAEGKNDEAQALIDKDFVCTGKGSGGANWGCYQVLAELEIAFDHKDKSKPINYKRELSLQNATANCTYEMNGVTYTREYFTSFGDDVSMIRLTASKPGMLNCRIG
ncbi:MAG TPA: glycoside hydrolase family 95 protein, partial [Chitinophagaceae bacterium]|nr:glycoside hydrolase family 95 protein [Chitinophagaceae bacterium]